MYNQPRRFEKKATEEMFIDQSLRSEMGETNQPLKQIQHRPFRFRNVACSIVCVMGLEWLFPGTWPYTLIIAGCILLNQLLDLL